MICICFLFLHFSTWKMRHMQPFTMHCARTSGTAASAAREHHHLFWWSLNWTSGTYERVEGESQNNNHHFSYKCNFQHIFMLYYMKKEEKEFIDMINYLWWFYVLCTFFLSCFSVFFRFVRYSSVDLLYECTYLQNINLWENQTNIYEFVVSTKT